MRWIPFGTGSEGAPLEFQVTVPNRSKGVEGFPGAVRVLLADNEIGTDRALDTVLRIAGFDVVAANDGGEALRLALNAGFDILVVEQALPVKNGLLVCQELRASQVHTAVVMLSARDQVMKAFAAGADDYLTRPFEVMELIARIRAIMRRVFAPPGLLFSQVQEFGNLRVDTASAAVWRGNELLRLSMMEYALLLFFVRHPNEVFSRRGILEECFKSSPEIGIRSVDRHVAWLRKKIGDDPHTPRWIRTVRGQGYSFVPR